MTAAENKIPDISKLLKKKDYTTKTSKIEKKVNDLNHDKYITTSEFNKFIEGIFASRLAQASLVIKADVDTKLISLNKTKNYMLKMNWRSYKHLIQVIFGVKTILKIMVHKII